MHVSLQQAVNLTGKSESTLRRAIRAGKVSAERDTRGHYQFDQAELIRAFGELKTTEPPDRSPTPSTDLARVPIQDQSREIALLTDNLADLRNQLEIVNLEKTVLLELLTAEKAERRALLPPPKQLKRNWLTSLFCLPVTQKQP